MEGIDVGKGFDGVAALGGYAEDSDEDCAGFGAEERSGAWDAGRVLLEAVCGFDVDGVAAHVHGDSVVLTFENWELVFVVPRDHYVGVAREGGKGDLDVVFELVWAHKVFIVVILTYTCSSILRKSIREYVHCVSCIPFNCVSRLFRCGMS